MIQKINELWQEFRTVFSGRTNTADTLIPPLLYALVNMLAGLVPGDVDAIHHDPWNGAQQRPGIARVRDARQLVLREIGCRAQLVRVNDRRLAGDGDRLLDLRDLHRGVDGSREADLDPDPLPDHRLEPGQLELDGVKADRQPRELVRARRACDRRHWTKKDRAGEGDGDARDDTARRKDLESDIKDWMPRGATVTIDSMTGLQTGAEPLRVAATIKLPGFATVTGRRIMLPRGIFQGSIGQPFRNAKRVHPVYFSFPWSESDQITVTLPDDFKVENLPRPREQQLPD